MSATTDYKLRPSAAAVWVLCHGMPSMSAGMEGVYDDDEDTTVREEGVAFHWAAYWASQGNVVAVGTVAPNGVEVDEEMLEHVEGYLAEVRSWQGITHFEQSVHCWQIHDQCGGTTDVCNYSPSEKLVRVGDAKYGYRFVDVLNNWQLICYLVGVLNKFNLQDTDVDVEFMIYQPRSYHRDGPMRKVRMPASSLREKVNQLRVAAHAVMGTNPTCKVNKGCRNCPGRVRCPAIHAAALGELDEAHAATPHDLPFSAAEDELRLLQWGRAIIDARITGLEQQVTHSMRRGAVSRHYAMEQTAGKLVWTEGASVPIQTIANLMKVQVSKPPAHITPTQAKKLLPESLVDAYSRRAPGAFKLVPADDHLMQRIFGKK